MKIKGYDGCEHNVASQAVGGTALGLGIGGVALGLMNGNGGCCNGGGLLGNLLGGNNNNCYVNKTELALSQQVAALQAEKYADQIAREESNLIFMEARRQDEKIAGVVKDTTGALIEIGNAVSGQAKEIACLQIEVARNREEAKSYTDMKVDYEAQLRKAADENIVSWTQAELNKKISGVLTLPESEINFSGCKPVLCSTRCLGTENRPLNVDIAGIAAAVAEAINATSGKK